MQYGSYQATSHLAIWEPLASSMLAREGSAVTPCCTLLGDFLRELSLLFEPNSSAPCSSRELRSRLTVDEVEN